MPAAGTAPPPSIRHLAARAGERVTLRGWLENARSSGKIAFLQVRDGSGTVQAVASKADLPEAEWEAAASFDPSTGRKHRHPWGDRPAAPDLANVDQVTFDTLPLGSRPENVSPIGCYGMVGDVWEWTSSDFGPYPGFEAFPYPEYSEVFFGTEYKVLRGGSWATRGPVSRVTFRNWDYPIRRQIFAGFRCARDE